MDGSSLPLNKCRPAQGFLCTRDFPKLEPRRAPKGQGRASPERCPAQLLLVWRKSRHIDAGPGTNKPNPAPRSNPRHGRSYGPDPAAASAAPRATKPCRPRGGSSIPLHTLCCLLCRAAFGLPARLSFPNAATALRDLRSSRHTASGTFSPPQTLCCAAVAPDEGVSSPPAGRTNHSAPFQPTALIESRVDISCAPTSHFFSLLPAWLLFRESKCTFGQLPLPRSARC